MSGRSRRIVQLQKELAAALKPLVPNAAKEARLLLMHHLKMDELELLMHQNDELADPRPLYEMLRRRMDNEPLEYITNRVSFYGEEFYIDSGALIPRPETELLVDEVLRRVSHDTTMRFVEVGVGSGIISVMLAKHLPRASFIAVDISHEALRVARKNIELHGLEKRIELRHSDLLERVDEKVDYLVSNPPYIQEGFELESNLSYEPQNALFGGEEGDELIKRLLDITLKNNIRFFTCEIGYDQKDKIASYLRDKSYRSLDFYKDYSGFDRGFTLIP